MTIGPTYFMYITILNWNQVEMQVGFFQERNEEIEVEMFLWLSKFFYESFQMRYCVQGASKLP